MKFGTALIASLLFCIPAALAQAPTGSTQTRPVQHQPGVSAGSAAAPSAGQPQGSASDSPAPPSLAQKPDPAEEAAIRHLMDLTDGSKLGDTITAVITNQVRTVMGRALPPDQLTAFMATFSERFAASAPPKAVSDAEVPIYAAHLSMDDIKALIQFFESPLGQRELKAMPLIAQESEKAGGDIDQKAVLQVLRGMTDTYPQLKQMLPPDPNTPAPAPSGASGSAPAPAPSAPRLAPAPNSAPAPSAPQK